jgi:hypothetical protein
MIPYDSFLLDPPMLFGSGWLAAKITNRLPPRVRSKALGALGGATMAIFWGTSVSLYFNREWTRWIWEMCGAESGRDWMLNSGVFRFDHENAGPRTHAVSVAILATYPAWLWLGMRAGGCVSVRLGQAS